MTAFICPACGTQTSLFCSSVTEGVDHLAKVTGLPILERIPIDPQLVESGDFGKPVLFAYPQAKVSQLYRRLAQKVVLFEQSNEKSARDYKEQ
ncbi:unnamed protein product [Echinostoma caproni]|uniref:Glutaredoxin n=1 Tax=Echinostoma caproni TaxID=27848 RepID=A0A183AZC4_9TREM|nr:unnamed protein product [Echinostoma caproni]